jgi:hypothetical protein
MVRLEVRDWKTKRRVELDELTLEGRNQIAYECDRMKEELEELDQAERDAEESQAVSK